MTRDASHSGILPLRDPPYLVLLVERDLTLRGSNANQLLDEGYEIVESDSASEAKSILDGRGDFDAMIVDIDPVCAPGGLALVRDTALRRGSVKILVESDWSEARSEADAVAAAFLSKPHSRDALVRKMRALLV